MDGYKEQDSNDDESGASAGADAGDDKRAGTAVMMRVVLIMLPTRVMKVMLRRMLLLTLEAAMKGIITKRQVQVHGKHYQLWYLLVCFHHQPTREQARKGRQRIQITTLKVMMMLLVL